MTERTALAEKEDFVEKAKKSLGALPIIPQITDAYVKAYIKLWEKAGQVGKAADLEHYAKKRAAMRSLMKCNDPGYPFMIDIFGEKMTHKVFDTVF